MRKYNIGEFVLFENGELGIVIKFNKIKRRELSIVIKSGQNNGIHLKTDNNGQAWHVADSKAGYNVNKVLTKEEDPEYYL